MRHLDSVVTRNGRHNADVVVNAVPSFYYRRGEERKNMYRGTNNHEEEVGLGWGGLVPTAEERRAEKREESAQHSLQQLKAEIAALANEIELDLSKGEKPYGPHRIVVILRQLSAV